MKLIDKDKVVAEIKRRRDLHYRYYIKRGAGSIAECKYDEDREILSFLDTLEVKEADLEEEAKAYIDKSFIDDIKNIIYEAPGVLRADKNKLIAWLEKQGTPQDKGEISDGYHTFNELYYYRMLYNAAFFNMLPKEWVHKSKKHYDGEDCFGGGWFIVMANLPTGQISNHYELKNWDLFQIPEKEVADKWDGHTPQEAADRLHKYLLEKQGEKKSVEWSEEDGKIKNELIESVECSSVSSVHQLRLIGWLKSLKYRLK